MKNLSFNARKESAKNKRLLMLGEEIKVAISNFLQRGKIKHPDVFGKNIIVTKVDVAKNLSNARVYIILCSNLENQEQNIKQILTALQQESGFIKKLLGKILALPIIPNIVFFNDSKINEISKIEQLLDNIKYDTKPN
ncbi:30S ribosome-binding factor RbfA [Rickettsiales bacterium LUAb2]